MADDTFASVIALHQPKRAKTPAQRARAHRPRKPRKAKPAPAPDTESQFSETLIPADFSSENFAFAEAPVTTEPRHAVPDRQVARRHAATPHRLHSAGGCCVRARWCRRHHQRLVRTIAWVERHRRMAVPGDRRSDRSRRAGVAVMCRRALAVPPARHLCCGMGCMGDDLCLCGHCRHRLCIGQHHRRHGGAGGARHAGRDGGPIGVERRHVGAGSGVRARRWQILPRARSNCC